MYGVLTIVSYRFHNCVWLVLNDVIIGVAFGSFLCENRFVFARWLHHGLETYLVDGMQHALLWLNNWPAGLKLNTELSQFYCHSLIDVVSIWGCTSLRHAPQRAEVNSNSLQGFSGTQPPTFLSSSGLSV